ncbi:MAG: class I SAM-dependent methyltransferase, partial [Pseudomonadota bacterium]
MASHGKEMSRVLVVGAGGGREIGEFRTGGVVGPITAIDPADGNLEMARAVADASPETRFIVGIVDDRADGETFDVVTSLLVMHHIPDDGSKLAYLRGLRQKLAPGGRPIHADMCFEEIEDFDRLIPAFQAHAQIFGVSADAARLECEAVAGLPVVSGDRMSDLFSQASL